MTEARRGGRREPRGEGVGGIVGTRGRSAVREEGRIGERGVEKEDSELVS